MLYTEPYDVADDLKSDKDIYWFLTAAFEDEGTVQELAHSIQTVSRSLGGVSKLSERTGIAASELERACQDGESMLPVLVRVVEAFGVKPNIAVLISTRVAA